MRDEAVIVRRLITVIGGLLTIAVGAYFLWPTAIGRVSPDRDFMGLWSAGRLALQGQGASAYSEAAAWPVQASHGARHWIPFRCAPPMLLLLAPFAWLPFAVAAPVWIAATYSAWLAAARRLLPGGHWTLATYPGLIMNAIFVQTGFVTSALFAGAMLTLETRPYLAGALLGALVVKPQLALLVPVALAAGRYWKAFLAAAASASGLLLLSMLVFGPHVVSGFLQGSRGGLQFLGAPAPIQLLMMPTVYAFAARLAGTAAAAWVQAGCAVLMAGVVAWTWSRRIDVLAKASILAVASILATPYLYIYDVVLLVVPLAWLMRREGCASWPLWRRSLVFLFAWSPFLANFLIYIIGLNLLPAILAVFLAVALWKARRPEVAARLEPAVG